MKQLYLDSIRPVMRNTLASLMPAPRFARQHLAVSGLPRSGTSWLARALSLAPRVSYYFEPDHVLDESYWYKYLPRDGSDEGLERHMQAVLAGKVRHEYVIAEQGFREMATHAFSDTVLVKWVRLVLALDWIAVHAPGLQIIQTVRHPVPLTLSWRAHDWDPGYSLQRLLKQDSLMQGPLQPFADIMREAGSFWEQAGAFWASVAYLQWQFHRPGWVLKEHEWYCLHAEERIGWLAGEMGLDISEKMREFINCRSSGSTGPGYGAARDPKAEIHKWEDKISSSELAELEQVVSRFSLPFYPGMDPEAFRKDDV